MKNTLWSTIIGHERVRTELEQDVARARLPNAYLFAGPDGVGKCLVAKTFAAALLCHEAAKPCGTCSACRKVAAEHHPDAFFLKPDGENIKIDQVRELATALQFHPLEGPAKIAIIDDAERLTEAAANAVLKTLEEPPPATHFILVSHAPSRLLPTIRSRCRKLWFSPLAPQVIADYLVRERNLKAHEAKSSAILAQGSLGRALHIDPVFSETVQERFTTLTAKPLPLEILATAEEWSQAGETAPLILEILATRFRNQLITAEGKAARRLHAAFVATAQAHRAVEETTANKQLLFEELLFTLLG